MRVCPECGGSGRVEDDDGKIVVCPECRGAGTVDENDQDEPATIREPEG
jgi:DnaJ-class molecular chaperone